MSEGLKNSPRTLEVEPGFREWMREHPGVLNAVREVVKTLETMPEEKLEDKTDFEIGAIEIKLQGAGDLNPDTDLRYYYLKASIQNEQFFIKVQTHKETTVRALKDQHTFIKDGADEFKSTLSAKERLAKIDWAEVVEPLFGYQETVNERKQSYFVTKWRDLPMAYEAYEELSGKNDPKADELSARLGELQKLLPDFYDVRGGNMFYDEATNKLVLYDISEQ